MVKLGKIKMVVKFKKAEWTQVSRQDRPNTVLPFCGMTVDGYSLFFDSANNTLYRSKNGVWEKNNG
jgi:hypothetical protein